MEKLHRLVVAGMNVLSTKADPHRSARLFVVIHGAWVDALFMEPFLHALRRQGVEAIAVSLRGEGGWRSLCANESLSSLSLGTHAEDVRRVIIELGPQEMVLVGHSLGGAIVQNMSDVPNLRLVALIASPRPELFRDVRLKLLGVCLKYLYDILRWNSIRPTYVDARALILNEMPEKDARAIYEHSLVEHVSAPISMALNFPALSAACPVVVIGGRQDKLFLPQNQLALARRYATKAVFLDTNHIGMFFGENASNLAHVIVDACR